MGQQINDANDPKFFERYPFGAIVRDKWGREVKNVIVCIPETGEVITADNSWLTGQWMRLLFMNTCLAWRLRLRGAKIHWKRGFYVSTDGYLLRKHGFWPAPLTITPKQRGFENVQ